MPSPTARRALAAASAAAEHARAADDARDVSRVDKRRKKRGAGRPTKNAKPGPKPRRFKAERAMYTDDEACIQTCFSLPPSSRALLNRIARIAAMSRSSVVRLAIRELAARLLPAPSPIAAVTDERQLELGGVL